MFAEYGELVELDLPQDGVFGLAPAPAPRGMEVDTGRERYSGNFDPSVRVDGGEATLRTRHR